MFRIARQVDTASAHRPLALATGRPGDVYLCHPFLVHAAQPHRGHRPRFMAQPPLHPATPFDLTRPDADLSPVERTIRDALQTSPQTASNRPGKHPGPSTPPATHRVEQSFDEIPRVKNVTS
jgi:hypothetical protein